MWKIFPEELIKNTVSCASFLKFWFNPSRAGPRNQHFNPPILGISRQVVTICKALALYYTFWMYCWGRKLLYISKALPNEGLVDSNKDFSHLDGPRSPGSLWKPFQALGESMEEIHHSWIRVDWVPDRHCSQVKERSRIHLRTKPKACYFSQSTKLNAVRDVGYLFKFLLWFHV